jgi:hypothetical protein
MPASAHSRAYLGLSSIKTWAPKDLQGGIAKSDKFSPPSGTAKTIADNSTLST